MFTIRPYKPQDREQIINLFLINTPTFFCPEEQKDLEEFLDEEEADEYFVAEEQGNIIACGGYAIEDNEGWLAWYIVHPSYQGKGAGRLIVQRSLDEMRKAKVSKLVVRTSQLVYKFYEKFGFELKSTQNDYWGKGMHLYKMEMDNC